MIATQEQCIVEIPWAPSYGIAPDRTVYSKKRRGRPSSRITRNPEWAPLKTHVDRFGAHLEFVVLWDGERTIRKTVDELVSTVFATE